MEACAHLKIACMDDALMGVVREHVGAWHLRAASWQKATDAFAHAIKHYAFVRDTPALVRCVQ